MNLIRLANEKVQTYKFLFDELVKRDFKRSTSVLCWECGGAYCPRFYSCWSCALYLHSSLGAAWSITPPTCSVETWCTILPGIDERRHELADVKRWHHQQSQCAQVYVFAQPQCFVTDQFRPEFDCVFPVRHIGWCSDSNQFCAIDLSDSLPGCFQHRRGVGFVSTVRLFPGYQLFIRNFHDASFLFFRHLLYRWRIFGMDAESFLYQPVVLLHPLFPRGRFGRSSSQPCAAHSVLVLCNRDDFDRWIYLQKYNHKFLYYM